MRYLFTAIILCLILSAGCRHDGNDPRLVRIAELTGTSPRQALEALDSINPSELSEGDRHLFDLLTIKAKDKVYITHTSDSLILDVISYYDRHRDNPHYPEALYYGGRVYSDLGDYPTSLTYFHRALDELPDGTKQLNLKCNVLSQTGRLLNTLRLYKEAIPYIVKSIEVDSVLNDSVNEVYDLQLLGGIYMRNNDYDTAERYFTEALEKSQNLPERFVAKSTMYLAAVKLRKNELERALKLIRHIPEKVSPIARNGALTYAIEIYREAGILDTAYIFARELIESSDELNKEIGYQTLLAPELRDVINRDSIDQYISEYRTMLENILDDNQNQLALTQQAHYNYQIHEREKNTAVKSKDKLQTLVIVSAFLILILSLFILYFKNRNQKNIIELQQAVDNINRLKSELNIAKEKVSQIVQDSGDSVQGYSADTPNPSPVSKPTEQNLREHLRRELLSLYELSSGSPSVPEMILQSDTYRTLKRMIEESGQARETDGIWEDLEKLVTAASPKFLSNLNLLTSGRMTRPDINTALLIKCGITPTQMAVLIGRGKTTVTYRRNALGKHIFGEKTDLRTIDAIIRLL